MRATQPIWPLWKKQDTSPIASGLRGGSQTCNGVAPMKLKTAIGGQFFLTWTAICKGLIAPAIRIYCRDIGLEVMDWLLHYEAYAGKPGRQLPGCVPNPYLVGKGKFTPIFSQ